MLAFRGQTRLDLVGLTLRSPTPSLERLIQGGVEAYTLQAKTVGREDAARRQRVDSPGSVCGLEFPKVGGAQHFQG